MKRKNKVLAVLLLTAVPTLAQANPSKPPRDEDVSKELIALRTKLIEVGKDRALQEVSRFRALCDDDGFPLVGNIAGKSNIYQPSAFCSDVRRKGNKA